MIDRLWKHDPTRPEQWPQQVARGRIAFQLRWGVIAIGTPIAILFDLSLLAMHQDGALFLSAHHAIQLLLISTTIGPLTGLIAGRILWRVGERRFGDALLTREFLGGEGTRSYGSAKAT